MRSNPPNARQLLQFMNELHFYSDIIQAIEQFQAIVHMPNEERIDAFARYFGSRLSLNADNKIADADAILLLENVKSSHFISPNRWNYFDRDEVLACLKVLTFSILKSTKRFETIFLLGIFCSKWQNCMHCSSQ